MKIETLLLPKFAAVLSFMSVDFLNTSTNVKLLEETRHSLTDLVN